MYNPITRYSFTLTKSNTRHVTIHTVHKILKHGSPFFRKDDHMPVTIYLALWMYYTVPIGHVKAIQETSYQMHLVAVYLQSCPVL